MSNLRQELSPEEAMRLAIQLAEQGRCTAPPNPWVGCVIVNQGCVVGEGYHRAAGEPHAEVHALRQAGALAKGATVYVTLEPCSHYGRTPPCAEALIAAQVAKVVVAVEDPDPRVKGQGIAKLRSAGIEVEVGLCKEEAIKSLLPYLYQRSTKRPYCVAKSAMSLDGRTAAADGSSQWITSEEARAHAHRLRAESQAILIGSGTALADRPTLTVRIEGPFLRKEQPLRVVLDARGRVEPVGPLFETRLAPTLILTTELADKERIAAWKGCGVQVEVLPLSRSGEGVDLLAVMELLGRLGVIQVLVEGGSTLLGQLLKERLIQALRLYVGPIVLGEKGKPLFSGVNPGSIVEAKALHSFVLEEVQKLGDCVCLYHSTYNNKLLR